MKKFLLGSVCCSLLSLFAVAQEVQLDSTFATNGMVIGSFNNNLHEFNQLKLNDDQSIILLGTNYENNDYKKFIAKYSSQGQLETSFGNNGVVIVETTNNDHQYFQRLFIQNDEKIVIGGYVENPLNNEKIYQIKRFLNNGNVDSTFGVDGTAVIFNDASQNNIHLFISDIGQHSDGKLLICAEGWQSSKLTRLNTNGSVDSTFGNDGNVAIDLLTTNGLNYKLVECLTDDKILLGAYVNFSNTSGTESNIRIYKLNYDGSLDINYGLNGYHTFELPNQIVGINGMHILNNNELLINGFHNDLGSTDNKILLYKLDSIGATVSAFGTNGYVSYNANSSDAEISDAAINNKGKIATTFFDYANGSTTIVMFNETGSLYDSFNNQSEKYIISNVNQGVWSPNIVIQNDDKILLAGATVIDSVAGEAQSILIRLKQEKTISINDIANVLAKIYPIPAKDQITVALINEIPAKITLVDITGKQLFQSTIKSTGAINVAHLSAGIYFINIQQGENIATQKIVIE